MSPRVLLVEDELLIRMVMRQELEDAGCSIVGEASDGNRAIALARETRPDMICMDIRLQGPLDGIETAQEIRRFSNAFFLFTSAYIQATNGFWADLQPCACVSKPLPPNALLEFARSL